MPAAIAIERRDDGQFQRRRQALGDQHRHLAALAQAQAEVARQRVADEARELDRRRPVEAQVGVQPRALRRGVASWPTMLLTGSPTYWNSENAPIPTTSITSTA